MEETQEEYEMKRLYFVGRRWRVKVDVGVNLLIKMSGQYFDLIHERLYTKQTHHEPINKTEAADFLRKCIVGKIKK